MWRYAMLVSAAAALLVLRPVASAPPQDMAVYERGPGYNTYEHRLQDVGRARGIRPVVDTAREQDKYGNDGGAARAASVGFIRASEGLAAAISPQLGKPNENPVNLLQGLFPILTDLGNRLGGIAKK